MKPIYVCMYMYMHLSSGLFSLFFFYLRMLIACVIHSKLYLKHKISINYDNQSGRIITHRTVQAHSQKHDEEEHCPQVGEGQFGQSLGVSNESQTGTYRAKGINVYHSSQSSEIDAVKDRLIHSKIYFKRERESWRERESFT